MKIIAKLIITALTLFFIVRENVVPGISLTGDNPFLTAVIVAVLLGVINLLIRPIILILTLPINLITFGLFTFVINALLFWGTAHFVPGFVVSGFVPALLGSLIIVALQWFVNKIL